MKKIVNKVLGFIGKSTKQEMLKNGKLNEAELNEVRTALAEIELRDR